MSLVNVLAAIITFFVLLIFFSFAFMYYRTFRETLFTVLQSHLIIEINDPTGDHATYVKIMRIRANHTGPAQYVHRNLSSDGSMQNFRVNGISVTPQMDAGDRLLYVDFGRPLRRGEEREIKLEIDLFNSFPATTEWITYNIAYPTRKLTIEVKLPSTRPAFSPEIYCLSGGEKERVSTKPQLLDNGCKIIWNSGDHRNLGSEYRLQWEWPRVS